jgi:hypothetical protein
MVIALIICLPICLCLGGFIAFKGVQLGLRWQMQISNNQVPTVANPIKEIIQEKKAAAAVNNVNNLFGEWINGKAGE